MLRPKLSAGLGMLPTAEHVSSSEWRKYHTILEAIAVGSTPGMRQNSHLEGEWRTKRDAEHELSRFELFRLELQQQNNKLANLDRRLEFTARIKLVKRGTSERAYIILLYVVHLPEAMPTPETPYKLLAY